MPRVEALEGRRQPWLLRVLEFVSRFMYDQPLTPPRVVAHTPRFLLPYLGLRTFVQGRSKLDPSLRAMAMHLVAVRNGCNWCLDYGEHEARRQGLDATRMAAVENHATDPAFSPAERAALALVDAMVRTDGHPDETTFARAREHFGDRELVELAMAAATENLFNWVNGTLGVESQGFCAMPSRGRDESRAVAGGRAA